MEILFRTIHGSNLYGGAHAGSDVDYFTVIPRFQRKQKKYARQTIKNGLDNLVFDFSTFRVYCDLGVPQALEALFSPMAEIDRIAEFRRAYRIDTGAVVGRYRRTIKSFSKSGDFKRRRHALRQALNLREAVTTGRFNPVMSEQTIAEITNMARMPDDLYLQYLEEISI